MAWMKPLDKNVFRNESSWRNWAKNFTTNKICQLQYDYKFKYKPRGLFSEFYATTSFKVGKIQRLQDIKRWNRLLRG